MNGVSESGGKGRGRPEHVPLPAQAVEQTPASPGILRTTPSWEEEHAQFLWLDADASSDNRRDLPQFRV